MSRLSRLALAKRSVTLLLAGALVIAGVSAWGSLQQELLPDIEFPVVTVVAPFPGAGSADVAEQVTKPIERTISVRAISAASASPSSDVAAMEAMMTGEALMLRAETFGSTPLGSPALARPSLMAVVAALTSVP